MCDAGKCCCLRCAKYRTQIALGYAGTEAVQEWGVAQLSPHGMYIHLPSPALPRIRRQPFEIEKPTTSNPGSFFKFRFHVVISQLDPTSFKTVAEFLIIFIISTIGASQSVGVSLPRPEIPTVVTASFRD